VSADPVRAAHDAIMQNAAGRGQVVAAGFAAFVAVLVKPETTPEVLDRYRVAYFSGAQHLFASIMSILDPGADPTEADLQRMTLIASELEAFCKELALRLTPTGAAQ
jgi:hypothetical protein